MTRKLSIRQKCLAIIAALLVLGGLAAIRQQLAAIHQKPEKGAQLDSWETSNNKFKIRVTTYDEEHAYLPGTYYVFSSCQIDSADWLEIMTFRHDDRPEIPREQVRFVNDEIAYVFMGRMYSVTTDGGHTWTLWDAQEDLEVRQWKTSVWIRDVKLRRNGSGTLILSYVGARNRDNIPREFQTKNYGTEWTLIKQ